MKIAVPSVAMMGMMAIPAEAQVAGLVWCAGRFADGILASALASSIREYLESLSDQRWIKNIEAVNWRLARDGYRDYSYSVVRRNDSNLYYPLVFENCGCKDCMVPFFDMDDGYSRITSIGGCHMAGLMFACDDLASQGWNRKEIASVLLPIREIKPAVGSRKDGYTQPLKYISPTAIVAAHYVPRDDRSGHVMVEAVRKTDGSLIYGQETTFSYA
ncbi:MAG TPA: hypothetical protein VG759_04280 [Candidatus Angelobacter sp.]|nr:hypothetical protein [Candidatus Angelobacter sp.]